MCCLAEMSMSFYFLCVCAFRRGIALAALGGPIYAIGGLDDNSCFNDVERYDIESDSWSAVAPMNTPRGGVGSVALGVRARTKNKQKTSFSSVHGLILSGRPHAFFRVTCTQWEETMEWRPSPVWRGSILTSTSGQRSARWASGELEMESANSTAASTLLVREMWRLSGQTPL